jgi:uncharacterized protein YjbJ (UPF0337 family)
MNKDHVKGTMDDTVGRAKRQIGEWTGDSDKQAEGTVQQVKGKVEKISGDVKDAFRNTTDSSRPPARAEDDDIIENDRTGTTGHRR